MSGADRRLLGMARRAAHVGEQVRTSSKLRTRHDKTRQERRRERREKGAERREKGEERREKTRQEKIERRDKMKKREKMKEKSRDKMKRKKKKRDGGVFFFSKKCLEHPNPPDELAQNVSKKFLSDDFIPFFSPKVQNLTVFSIVFRFFLLGELNQRTVSAAQFMKGRPLGHRYRKLPENKEYHQAHNLKKEMH